MDCNMFMHYIGGGIGHKVTNHILQARAGRTTKTEGDIQEDLIVDDVGNIEDEPHLNMYGADEDGHNEDGDRDVKEVNMDEEADFGYRDSEGSEGEESKDEDDSDGEDKCIYEL
jgi:hypothetical protein